MEHQPSWRKCSDHGDGSQAAGTGSGMGRVAVASYILYTDFNSSDLQSPKQVKHKINAL